MDWAAIMKIPSLSKPTTQTSTQSTTQTYTPKPLSPESNINQINTTTRQTSQILKAIHDYSSPCQDNSNITSKSQETQPKADKAVKRGRRDDTEVPKHILALVPDSNDPVAMAAWIEERKRKYPRRAISINPSNQDVSSTTSSTSLTKPTNSTNSTNSFSLGYSESESDSDSDQPPEELSTKRCPINLSSLLHKEIPEKKPLGGTTTSSDPNHTKIDSTKVNDDNIGLNTGFVIDISATKHLLQQYSKLKDDEIDYPSITNMTDNTIRINNTDTIDTTSNTNPTIITNIANTTNTTNTDTGAVEVMTDTTNSIKLDIDPTNTLQSTENIDEIPTTHSTSSTSSTSSISSTSNRPCRHFMRGACRHNSNCTFLHDEELRTKMRESQRQRRNADESIRDKQYGQNGKENIDNLSKSNHGIGGVGSLGSNSLLTHFGANGVVRNPFSNSSVHTNIGTRKKNITLGTAIAPPNISLMRRLAANDILKEQNKILQCFEYIINRNFFQNDKRDEKHEEQHEQEQQ